MVSERTSRLVWATVLGALVLYLLFGLGLIGKVAAHPEDPPYDLAWCIVALVLVAQAVAGASKETLTWSTWIFLAVAFGETLPRLVVDARENATARWLLAALGLMVVLLVLGRFLLPPDVRARLYGTRPKPSAGAEGS